MRSSSLAAIIAYSTEKYTAALEAACPDECVLKQCMSIFLLCCTYDKSRKALISHVFTSFDFTATRVRPLLVPIIRGRSIAGTNEINLRDYLWIDPNEKEDIDPVLKEHITTIEKGLSLMMPKDKLQLFRNTLKYCARAETETCVEEICKQYKISEVPVLNLINNAELQPGNRTAVMIPSAAKFEKEAFQDTLWVSLLSGLIKSSNIELKSKEKASLTFLPTRNAVCATIMTILMPKFYSLGTPLYTLDSFRDTVVAGLPNTPPFDEMESSNFVIPKAFDSFLKQLDALPTAAAFNLLSLRKSLLPQKEKHAERAGYLFYIEKELKDWNRESFPREHYTVLEDAEEQVPSISKPSFASSTNRTLHRLKSTVELEDISTTIEEKTFCDSINIGAGTFQPEMFVRRICHDILGEELAFRTHLKTGVHVAQALEKLFLAKLGSELKAEYFMHKELISPLCVALRVCHEELLEYPSADHRDVCLIIFGGFINADSISSSACGDIAASLLKTFQRCHACREHLDTANLLSLLLMETAKHQLIYLENEEEGLVLQHLFSVYAIACESKVTAKLLCHTSLQRDHGILRVLLESAAKPFPLHESIVGPILAQLVTFSEFFKANQEQRTRIYIIVAAFMLRNTQNKFGLKMLYSSLFENALQTAENKNWKNINSNLEREATRFLILAGLRTHLANPAPDLRAIRPDSALPTNPTNRVAIGILRWYEEYYRAISAPRTVPATLHDPKTNHLLAFEESEMKELYPKYFENPSRQ
jgi:hypothetical protein